MTDIMTSLSVHQLQSTVIGEIKGLNMLKTGIAVVDMVIMMVITAGLLYLMNSWKEVLEWGKRKFTMKMKPPVTTYTLEINSSKTVSTTNGSPLETSYNDEQIYAVLYYTQKHNTIDYLRWENKGTSANSDNTYLIKKTCNFEFIPNDTTCIISHNGLIFTLTYKRTKTQGDHYRTDDKTLTLSTTHSMEVLKNYANLCHEEYVEFKYKKYDCLVPPLYYYTIDESILGDKGGDKPKSSIYQRYELNSTRQFSNIFFPEKKGLLKLIDNFMNKRGSFNPKYGLPYRCNMLIHGPPGTGKSSIIKAMANLTRKHVVNVNLKQIKTNNELMKLFFQSDISLGNMYVHVPYNQRIYILEEIDTMDITHTRQETIEDSVILSTPETKSNDNKNESDKEMKEMKEMLLKVTAKDNDITLGSLLTLLDGILELCGSIIIMTSNHPEKLDPALVRPGRVNYKLFLDHMKLPAMCEMIELYLEHKYTVDDLIKLGLKEGQCSAAEIESILLASSTKEEFEKTIQLLHQRKKEEKWEKLDTQ